MKVSVYEGNICKETSDVIVNSTNGELKHRTGLPAAIVKAGGKSIQDECDEIMKTRRHSPLAPGEVVVTKAGNLPSNRILHAVAPKWDTYSQSKKNEARNALFNALLNSLKVASQNSATSISIPAIGSGMCGVPVQICAEVLFTAATHFAKNASSSNTLKDIRFVDIDKTHVEAFAQEMKKRFGALVRRKNV